MTDPQRFKSPVFGIIKVAILEILAEHGPLTNGQIYQVIETHPSAAEARNRAVNLKKAVDNAVYRMKAKGELKYHMGGHTYELPPVGSAPPAQMNGSTGARHAPAMAPPPPRASSDHPSRIGNPPAPAVDARPCWGQEENSMEHDDDEPPADAETIEEEGGDDATRPSRIWGTVNPPAVPQNILAIRCDMVLGADEILAIGADRVHEMLRAAAIIAGLQAELDRWDWNDVEEEEGEPEPASCMGCGCTGDCDAGDGESCLWVWLDESRGVGVCSSCFEQVRDSDA